MLIAFIGMDGVGKTTFTQDTVDMLTDQGKWVTYLCPFEYIFLKPLLSLIKGYNGQRNASTTNPFLTKSKKSLLLQLWPLCALVDNWIYYLIKIKPLLFKGKDVVCDRYFYDFATSFAYYGYANPTTTRLYLTLIPRPDIVFVLDAPPDVAQARAQELSNDFYIEQRDRYLCVANRFGFPVLTTTKKSCLTQEQIMETISLYHMQ